MYNLTQPVDSWKPVFDDENDAKTEADDDVQDPNVELPTVNNSKVSMTDASRKFNNAFVSEIEVEITRF